MSSNPIKSSLPVAISQRFTPWKTLARETLLKGGKYLTVERHTVELPDGRIIKDWDWIITPDYINAVVVTTNSTFLCFRQTKYAVQGTSLAPLGGHIEAGETPLDTAKRELVEEMGYVADRWIDLGHYVVDGNREIATAYYYLALDAHPTRAAASDDLEEQELLELTRDELRTALHEGEFRVLAWAGVVALALNYLEHQL